MTAFHDAVLVTDPVVFVPFDAPGDTATTAANLGSAGGSFVSTVGGTRQAAPGSVAFGNEVEFDGVDDYWSADATLFNALKTAIAAATGGSTWAIWWRHTVNEFAIRFLMRFDPWGTGIYRQSGAQFGLYYDLDDDYVEESEFLSHAPEVAGGWQLTGMQLDPAEGALITMRNGWRRESLTRAAGNDSTIRTTGTTSFVIGKNPSTGTNHMWDGSLGPLMVWDRPLSGDEFMSTYLAGLGVAETQDIALVSALGRMRPDAIILRGDT